MQLIENTVPRGLPLVEIVEPATIRLISTAYIEEHAMAPLADTDAALAFLEEIERKTSLRQNEDMPLPSDVRQDELLTSAYGYGWTYVNAAFCYTRPQGSRLTTAIAVHGTRRSAMRRRRPRWRKSVTI